MAEKATVPSTPAAQAVGGDHDRVVIASRRADGTPDQTPDFTYIGDEATSIEAAKRQLSEQAVSAVDVRERGVGGPGAASPGEPDPDTRELQKKQESAASAAAKAGESEVKARFEDVTK